MNVLFITRKWPPAVGGMETYAERLSEELSKLTGLTVLSLPGRRNGRPPTIWSLLGFGLRTAITAVKTGMRYDVVHGGDLAIWPLVFLAGLRNGTSRLFLSAHGSDVAYANRRGVKAFLYRRYLHLGASLMKKAHIVANSHATAALCEEHGLKNIVVIPLAAKSFAMLDKAIPPKPYVAFIGRLLHQKGCGWFIENVLPKLREDFRVKVAGTIIDSSEKAALDNPRVDYLGPVFGNALADLRQSAAAVIVPNIQHANREDFEGFGLAAVEGAADGGIVLASSLYGIRDAVRDEETGFLLPAGDADAWAEKINEIISWRLEDRGLFLRRASSVIRNQYSWSRVAAETNEAYAKA